MLPLPLSHLLVPPPAIAVPAGFEPVSRVIVTGLPLSVPLGNGYELLLVMPTGLARQWMEARGGDLVASSEGESRPHDAAVPAESTFARAPVRWLVKRGGKIVAAVPFSVGTVRRVCDGGAVEQGVGLELITLSWRLHAGSMRGAGDFGSQVEFAWRIADRAADQFGTPLVSRRVLERKPPEQRIESHLALIIPRHLLIQGKAANRLISRAIR
jgi:hypothetical protein